jgi:predicted TIM-barrel fold metal-dependent hydrolase
MAADRLERFPNFAVDFSARVGSLQRQDSSKVRDWFIAYPDRILYGTDRSLRSGADPQEFSEVMHDTWLADWEYLSTDNEIPSPRRSEEGVTIKGLSLPMDVLEKVYGENARRWYPGLPG